eukprot:c19088_g1_i1 orf=185-796(-)
MATPSPTHAFPPCELCHSPAYVLCPSDDAFLCWDCDSAVHSANFLVARHHRTFLCHTCSCLTTVVASGAFLPPGSRLCARCSPILTEACCSSRSGSSDSECSELTSDCESESEPMLGTDRSQGVTAFYMSRCKGPLELQVPIGAPDALHSGYVSDSMSGVEDELTSEGSNGTSSPSTSCSGDGVEGNAVAHARHRSCYRFSRG